MAADARTAGRPCWRWWEAYGDLFPALTPMAIRTLACVASSSACERNWKDYTFIHTKPRNRLKADKAKDLVYVHSNLRLLRHVEGNKVGGKEVPWLHERDGLPPTPPESGSDRDEAGDTSGSSGSSSGSSSSDSSDMDSD
jgi:hypothetical protein